MQNSHNTIKEAHKPGDPPNTAEEFSGHVESSLGTTDDMDTGGFILPNGKLVNCAPPPERKGVRGYQFTRMAHKLALQEMYGSDAPTVDEIVDLGVIRISPESGGIQIHKLPTSSQFGTIRKFIKEVGQKFDIVVDLRSGGQKNAQMYDQPVNEALIIADIERFFKSPGQPARRSMVAQFHGGGFNEAVRMMRERGSVVFESVREIVESVNTSKDRKRVTKAKIMEVINEIGSHGFWFEQFLFFDKFNTMVELRPFDGALWVSSITSVDRRQGNATGVMKLIHEIADKHDVPVALNPEPFGERSKDKLNKIQLKSWYKRLGYKPAYGNVFWRSSEKPEEAKDAQTK